MATNTSKESNENTENTTEDHKIVVIGGNKVGKTTIVQQFLKKQEKVFLLSQIVKTTFSHVKIGKL